MKLVEYIGVLKDHNLIHDTKIQTQRT